MQFGTIPNADSDQYNQKQEENVKKMCTSFYDNTNLRK